jgi:hypothetical protein
MHRILNPKTIYLASHDAIVAGSIATIAALKAHASAMLVPSRLESGITLHISGEDVDLMEISPASGLQVLVDRVRKTHGIGLTINFGQWSHKVESIRRGQLSGDVDAEQTASISAADDATAMTGLKPVTTLVKEKLAILIELPGSSSGDSLYVLFTKMIAAAPSADISLNNSQQQNSIRLDCVLLESTELSSYQDIHAEITSDGFWYPIEGAIDA